MSTANRKRKVQERKVVWFRDAPNTREEMVEIPQVKGRRGKSSAS